MQEQLGAIRDLGADVVALSVDPRREADAAVHESGLDYTVGHDADPDDLARRFGCYVDPEERYLQASAFVLDPRGRVSLAVYSSGAIGRLDADDVVTYLDLQHDDEDSSG